jgi:hypothetical protein
MAEPNADWNEPEAPDAPAPADHDPWRDPWHDPWHTLPPSVMKVAMGCFRSERDTIATWGYVLLFVAAKLWILFYLASRSCTDVRAPTALVALAAMHFWLPLSLLLQQRLFPTSTGALVFSEKVTTLLETLTCGVLLWALGSGTSCPAAVLWTMLLCVPSPFLCWVLNGGAAAFGHAVRRGWVPQPFLAALQMVVAAVEQDGVAQILLGEPEFPR